MSTKYNRIKVADLEKNERDKILTTNDNGELEFKDIESVKTQNYNALDYNVEGKALDARQGKVLKDLIDNIKDTLKTYFDTLYLGISNDQNVSGIKTFLAGKLGIRNVANTFTSFFTNANTASRTYTLPNKDGIVAMTSDISPNIVTTGSQNSIPKYGLYGATLGNSRIADTGSKIVVDNYNTAELDLQFNSIKNSNVIGSETAASGVNGTDFVIKGGSTSSSQTQLIIKKMGAGLPATATSIFSSNYSDNVYACAGTVMYKFDKGTGSFSIYATGLITGNSIWGGCESPTGDVYYINQARNIYKQTNGTGAFVLYASLPAGFYGTGITITPNKDIYACTFSGKIYKQTNSTGSFIDIGEPSRNYMSLTSDLNNNIYIAEGGNNSMGGGNGYMYKQTNSTGVFTQMDSTFQSWNGIVWDRIAGDLYCSSVTAVYKFTGGSGSAISLGVSFGFACATLAICKTILFTAWVNTGAGLQDIYSFYINSAGLPDLNGGILKQKAGIGKGAGQSRIQFITGQKTASGTNLQAETLRCYIDENGYLVWLNMPTYADNSTAIAAGLPVGCEYKTATGDRKIVY
ncbi:hypothetical protein DBB36_02145 [Flavobacterium sp. WLB]|uniref:hypothetical protein n=1 Tax=unclassified Flavobacterium TaxID=196869 RepID=UPI0006ABD3EA|nr:MULTISPECIES: hypothetical protein [unclassified Flavobacterium]KOP39223.1 hypothetical protein AKO67_06675 [Flavobacterium sp. VMW]OWU89114.1 hypothetical protein APR43_18080 [Flavobacterium sp. NLM]PUU71681.1 hypothetical protein DBB36_02145 [Flavobacterium sp. WLB]